jgi:small subunit ribosomal protein S1
VNIGDEIEAVVLKVDSDDEKISLGMKQIEEDPWLALPLKYPTGTRLQGKVRNLTSFGAFVEIEPGIDGLVHVSDMSWTRRVEHPSEVVQKGQDLEVLVLDVDAENKRISLGIKQLQDDPWPGISERFAPGVECEGKVVRVQEKGVVVDLGDDIEGFVPGSHAAVNDLDYLDEYYHPGDDASLRVMESDASNRRIVLEVLSEPVRRARVVEEPAVVEEGEAGAEGQPSGEAVSEAQPVTEEVAEAPVAEAAPDEAAPDEAAPVAETDVAQQGEAADEAEEPTREEV